MKTIGSWLGVAAGLAAGLAVTMAPTFASARGGGGGHVVIVTVGGGGVASPIFSGEEAGVAWEVTDAAPTAVDGEMRIGDIIGVHTIRSSAAIVLLDTAKGRHGDLPAGVVLAKMQLASANHHGDLWCDLRAPHRLFYPQMRDCFEDDAGSGKLNKSWEGNSLFRFIGFSTAGVGGQQDLVAGPGYRQAGPEERAVASLGYKYCDGDGVSTPPRFALTVSTHDEGKDFSISGDCRFGSWPDPGDKSKVRVDGLMLDVRQGADGVLHYHVLGRIPPEPLGLLRNDQPLQSVADTPSMQDLKLRRHVSLSKPMLAFAGTPSLIPGAVAVGQVFATVKVKHTLTGILQNRISTHAPFVGTRTLEPGQPVFAVPYPGVGGDAIAWCAPHRGDAGYQTTCLSPTNNETAVRVIGYYWNDKMSPALAPNAGRLGWISMSGVASSDPDIKPGPIDLPPMTLTIKLAEVSSDNAGVAVPVYHVEGDLDWGDGPQLVGKQTYEVTASGKVVELMGMKMRLKPGADADHMIVEQVQ